MGKLKDKIIEDEERADVLRNMSKDQDTLACELSYATETIECLIKSVEHLLAAVSDTGIDILYVTESLNKGKRFLNANKN